MTMDLMREVRYDGAYTFMYSARERTKAWEMGDSVPEEVKSRAGDGDRRAPAD